MAVRVQTPPAGPDRRDQKAHWTIVGAAATLAVVAALAAQMGVAIAQPLVGAIVILGIAYACSTDRGAIDGRTVAWGLSLQVVFALVVLKTTIGQRVFSTLGAGINKLLGFSRVGADFVFGPLGNNAVWSQVMKATLSPADAARYS